MNNEQEKNTTHLVFYFTRGPPFGPRVKRIRRNQGKPWVTWESAEEKKGNNTETSPLHITEMSTTKQKNQQPYDLHQENLHNMTQVVISVISSCKDIG